MSDRPPLRVFVSHTSELSEFPDDRSFVAAAKAAVERAGHAVVEMEYFGVDDVSPVEVCQRGLAACDVYVGIHGFRYGTPVPDSMPPESYTRMEFRCAGEKEMPQLCFVLDEDTPIPWKFGSDPEHGLLQMEFRAQLFEASGLTVAEVSSPDQLEIALFAWLERVGRAEPTPNAPARPRRRPFMAAPVEPGIVTRGRLLERVAGEVLAARNGDGHVVISTKLFGAGGFGKTTLAQELCQRLRPEFPDGVLWVTLGQEPNMLGALTKLYDAVAGEAPPFVDAEHAAYRLAELLAGGAYLIVVDDVWEQAHLNPFVQIGRPSVCVVTTRLRGVAGDATHVDVDEMSNAEAVEVLTCTLPGAVDDLSPFRALAARLGEWPLLLRLAAATLADLARTTSIAAALDTIHELLRAGGTTALDREDTDDRKAAVALTMDYSLRRIREDEQAKYFDLGLFREDEEIPFAVLARLWGLPKARVLQVAVRWRSLALAHIDLDKATVRLHDVVREFLIERFPGDIRKRQGDLVTALGPPEDLAATDRYGWLNYGYHLRWSDDPHRLHELLGASWRSRKLQVLGSNHEFSKDLLLGLEVALEEEPVNLVEVVRYSVLHAGLASGIGAMPPELFGLMAKVGEAKRAMDNAILAADEVDRARCFAEIVLDAPDDSSRRLALDQFIAIVQGRTDRQRMVAVYRGLVVRLVSGLLGRDQPADAVRLLDLDVVQPVDGPRSEWDRVRPDGQTWPATLAWLIAVLSITGSGLADCLRELQQTGVAPERPVHALTTVARSMHPEAAAVLLAAAAGLCLTDEPMRAARLTDEALASVEPPAWRRTRSFVLTRAAVVLTALDDGGRAAEVVGRAAWLNGPRGVGTVIPPASSEANLRALGRIARLDHVPALLAVLDEPEEPRPGTSRQAPDDAPIVTNMLESAKATILRGVLDVHGHRALHLLDVLSPEKVCSIALRLTDERDPEETRPLVDYATTRCADPSSRVPAPDLIRLASLAVGWNANGAIALIGKAIASIRGQRDDSAVIKEVATELARVRGCPDEQLRLAGMLYVHGAERRNLVLAAARELTLGDARIRARGALRDPAIVQADSDHDRRTLVRELARHGFPATHLPSGGFVKLDGEDLLYCAEIHAGAGRDDLAREAVEQALAMDSPRHLTFHLKVPDRLVRCLPLDLLGRFAARLDDGRPGEPPEASWIARNVASRGHFPYFSPATPLFDLLACSLSVRGAAALDLAGHIDDDLKPLALAAAVRQLAHEAGIEDALRAFSLYAALDLEAVPAPMAAVSLAIAARGFASAGATVRADQLARRAVDTLRRAGDDGDNVRASVIQLLAVDATAPIARETWADLRSASRLLVPTPLLVDEDVVMLPPNTLQAVAELVADAPDLRWLMRPLEGTTEAVPVLRGIAQYLIDQGEREAAEPVVRTLAKLSLESGPASDVLDAITTSAQLAAAIGLRDQTLVLLEHALAVADMSGESLGRDHAIATLAAAAGPASATAMDSIDAAITTSCTRNAVRLRATFDSAAAGDPDQALSLLHALDRPTRRVAAALLAEPGSPAAVAYRDAVARPHREATNDLLARAVLDEALEGNLARSRTLLQLVHDTARRADTIGLLVRAGAKLGDEELLSFGLEEAEQSLSAARRVPAGEGIHPAVDELCSALVCHGRGVVVVELLGHLRAERRRRVVRQLAMHLRADAIDLAAPGTPERIELTVAAAAALAEIGDHDHARQLLSTIAWGPSAEEDLVGSTRFWLFSLMLHRELRREVTARFPLFSEIYPTLTDFVHALDAATTLTEEQLVALADAVGAVDQPVRLVELASDTVIHLVVSGHEWIARSLIDQVGGKTMVSQAARDRVALARIDGLVAAGKLDEAWSALQKPQSAADWVVDATRANVAIALARAGDVDKAVALADGIGKASASSVVRQVAHARVVAAATAAGHRGLGPALAITAKEADYLLRTMPPDELHHYLVALLRHVREEDDLDQASAVLANVFVLDPERQAIVADAASQTLGIVDALALLQRVLGGRDLRLVLPLLAPTVETTDEMLALLAVARSDLVGLYSVIAEAGPFWQRAVPPDDLLRMVTYSL